MPGVIANGKSVSGVWRKQHLRLLWHGTIEQFLVKDRADIGIGIVLWQVELDSDSFPMRIGVRCNEIAGNIACEDRNRIHTNFGKLIPESLRKPRREASD